MTSAQDAIEWMRDQSRRNTRGWRGLCLRASRTAWRRPGGWHDANAWWAAVPAQHKHGWSSAPPLGAPVFFAGGRHGHIGLSDGQGGMWHTDAPNVDRIGHTSINWPRDRWGFRNVGWASWLNGAALPVGGTQPPPPTTPEPTPERGSVMIARFAGEQPPGRVNPIRPGATFLPTWSPVTVNTPSTPRSWNGARATELTVPLGGWVTGVLSGVALDAPVIVSFDLLTAEGVLRNREAQVSVPAGGRFTVPVSFPAGAGARVRWNIWALQNNTRDARITELRTRLGVILNGD